MYGDQRYIVLCTTEFQSVFFIMDTVQESLVRHKPTTIGGTGQLKKFNSPHNAEDTARRMNEAAKTPSVITVCGKEPTSRNSSVRIGPCALPQGHIPETEHESAQYPNDFFQTDGFPKFRTIKWSDTEDATPEDATPTESTTPGEEN